MEYLVKQNVFFSNENQKITDDIHIEDVPDTYSTVTNEQDYWKFHHNNHNAFPNQGWKIHISTNINEFKKTLKIVSKVAFEYNLSFKHLKNYQLLYKTNSKNANRESAGKFITIYPDNDRQFLVLIEKLKQNLDSLKKGPYILSDKRWKDSNVYYRYGGFKRMYNQKNELCIFDEKGDLIVDERRPFYQVPDFKKDFDSYLDSLNFSNNAEIDTEGLQRYNFLKSLSFSNSGGVYLAECKQKKTKVIIKESRPYTGYDGQYRSSFDRQNIEYVALNELQNVKGIVNLIDYFQAWEHRFIVEEYINGVDLHTWISRNYPFFLDSDKQAYQSKIHTILNQLISIVNRMHDKEIAMGDLQPANIIIEENLNVNLIDFETATNVNEKASVGMATPAFSSSYIENNRERDWYSVKKIIHFCLLPTYTTAETEVYLKDRHYSWIDKHYGSYFDNILKSVHKKLNITQKNNITQKSLYTENIIEKLNKGMLSNLEKSERLLPGDIDQYEKKHGKIDLLSGGGGIIWSLFRTCGYTNSSMLNWINNYVLNKQKDFQDNGLFTGKAGIAIVLYECGFVKNSIELFDSITIDKEDRDFSLRSGQSGIGLAMLSLYVETRETKYLNFCEKIANNVWDRIEESKGSDDLDNFVSALGLIDGWSGIGLFYISLYKHTKKSHFAKKAKIIVDEDLKKIEEFNDTLQIRSKKDTLIPYLSGGSIGVCIAMHYYNKIIKCDEGYQNKIQKIINLYKTRVTLSGGFFEGAAGFLLLPTFLEDQNNKKYEKVQKEVITLLNLFLVSQKDYLIFPGQFSFRFSFDFMTGSAGVSLALSSMISHNPMKWIPCINNNNFFS